MEKVNINFESLAGSLLLSTTNEANVYKLSDGSVLKLFSPIYLRMLDGFSIRIEDNILESSRIFHDGIITPRKMCYTDDRFVGYIRDDVSGRTLKEIIDGRNFNDRENLYHYAIIHYNLEKVLKECKDVVFPKLDTILDGIVFEEDLKPVFINCEDLQFNKFLPIKFSSLFGEKSDMMTSKYFKDGFFTKNLDVRSSIYLYFLDTFNINLNNIKDMSQLEDIFNRLGLLDDRVFRKVLATMDDGLDNEFLGEDVFRIADRYDMKIVFDAHSSSIKRLMKKR